MDIDQEISLDELLGTPQSPTTSSSTNGVSQRVSIDLELFLQEGTVTLHRNLYLLFHSLDYVHFIFFY